MNTQVMGNPKKKRQNEIKYFKHVTLIDEARTREIYRKRLEECFSSLLYEELGYTQEEVMNRIIMYLEYEHEYEDMEEFYEMQENPSDIMIEERVWQILPVWMNK